MAQDQARDCEEVSLNAEDIPGAVLTDPLDKHKIPSLRWWLLCRGITAPHSLKKKELIDRSVYSTDSSAFLPSPCRIKEVRKESKPVVDVDGSYIYKKYKMLASVGKQVFYQIVLLLHSLDGNLFVVKLMTVYLG